MENSTLTLKQVYLIFLLLLLIPGSIHSQPVISSLVVDPVNEGMSFNPISLDDYVTDAAYPDQELTWEYKNNENLSVSIINRMAAVVPQNADWFGSETIRFIVHNPASQSDTEETVFSVLPVNDAPIVSMIPSQRIYTGKSFSNISLDDYVSDVDDDDASITWNYATDNGNLSAEIINRVATVHAASGWTGSGNLTFTATDPDLLSDFSETEFRVKSVPVAVDETYTVSEGKSFSTPAPGVLSNDTDADGDMLTAILTVAPVHGTSAPLSADGSVNYSHDGSSGNNDGFKYQVSDGDTMSNEATVSITVNQLNDPPMITNINDQSITRGESFTIIPLNTFVSDEDDEDNLMAWTWSGNSNLQVNINPANNEATITPSVPSWYGEETITFKATDDSGSFDTDPAVFKIEALLANPTDIILTPSAINENINPNAYVGTFTCVDADLGETYTYTLVAGAGDTDNSSFTITGGNQLYATLKFDHETKDVYYIRVRVDDNGGGFYEEPLTVSVNDLNENPIDIALSSNLIPENLGANAFVGTLSSTDPDAGSTFTYTLVTGSGDTDNGSFYLNGSQLRATSSFDFETKSSYTVRIRTTDGPGLYYEEAFPITVLNFNESPTDISLSASSVNENVSAGTTVGLLSSSDPDAGSTFTYTLVTGSGDTDNSSFNIPIGTNQLNLVSSPNFETKSSYAVRIRTTDAGSLYYEKAFTISINDVNEAPTDITLSATAINENNAVNAVVGNLTTTDPDAGNTFTYTLVSGDGSTDNSLFSINGSQQLIALVTLDAETKPSCSVRIRSTDQGGSLYFEKKFTITVNNIPEAPTNISLSPSAIDENIVSGSVVGTLTSTDPDVGATFTYTLVTGDGSTDNGSFTISGNQLLSGAVFDFETKASYFIRIRSTDNSGLYFEKQFTIGINNINDAPTNISLSVSGINENMVVNSIVGTFTTTDQDFTDLTFSYTLASGSGDTDNGSFNINNNELRINGPFNYEVKNTYYIRIRTTDASSAFYEKNFTINVVNVNEAPVLSGIEGTALAYNEGDGAVNVTGTLLATDVDNTSLNSATVQITTNYTAAEDVLSFTDQNGIAGSWNSTTGTMQLTGIATIADYQIALRSVKYTNSSISPSGLTRTVSFTAYDGALTSNIVTRSITVNSTNSLPVISGIATEPLKYCARSGKQVIASSMTISDADNPNMAGATVQIKTNLVTAEDVLVFTDQNGITGSYNASNGLLTLTGSATRANYETALESVKYENTNLTNPSVLTRTVSFVVNDGTNNSTEVNRDINVKPVLSASLPTSDFELCNDGSSTVNVPLTLTGSSPWAFTVRRNASEDTIYTNISSATYNIKGRVIGGGTSSNYQVISVTDASGCTNGSVAGLATVKYKASPSAVISETKTVCPGTTAALTVTLTGSPNWSFKYKKGSEAPVLVSGINSSPYTLNLTQPGTYTLTEVSDAVCTGKVSGTGEVNNYTVPTATISGTINICEYTTGTLNVALTGEKNWKYSYKINGADPAIIVDNVAASPNALPVTKAGTYKLFEVYDKNCKGTVTGEGTVTVTQAPEVTISGLAKAYNKSVVNVPVYGTPVPGVFEEKQWLFKYEGVEYFWPYIAGIGTHKVIYKYQDPGTTCWGYDTSIVRVIEANASIFFENDRKEYCINDAPFEIVGVNINDYIGSFLINDGLTGLVDNGDNTATVYPEMLAPGAYTIKYSYTDETPLSVTSIFNIGAKPVANFTWASECFQPGQTIQFTNKSVSTFGYLNDTSYFWKFYNNSGYDSSEQPNVEYTFEEAGEHSIELQLQNTNGCVDTIRKAFNLRPIIALGSENHYESFEGRPLGWDSNTATDITVNSWHLGNPTKGFSLEEPNENCWYTEINSSSPPREQSWITSPCFDFTGTQKPMLKMDLWRLYSLNTNTDGGNIQATADSGKTWNLVGHLGDGVNWYNSVEIGGNPGGFGTGWSNVKDADWIETRHSLDELKGQPRVQFRITYGSDNRAKNTNGFAFDNFAIVDRSRMALIEHFTNSSDEDSEAADSTLDDITAEYEANIVNIQYHTAFPSGDPFYGLSPEIPTTRQFYYGLSQVPYAILNGGLSPAHRFDYIENSKPLDENAAIIESLRDSKFDIGITSSVDNILKTRVQIIARENVPHTLIKVRIAIIERIIENIHGSNGDTVFRNVVKAMLPSAAGTTFDRSWNITDASVVDASWPVTNVYNPAELRVVAFIQNESTKEVYQVALDTIGIITATHDPNIDMGDAEGFRLYPNPAKSNITVLLNGIKTAGVDVNIYNNQGKLMFTYFIPSGSISTAIPVSDLPDGLYLIRLTTKNKMLGVKKLIVSK